MADWEISLPARGATALSRSKPRARLVLRQAGSERTIIVPVSVARKLKDEIEENPRRFSSVEDVLAEERRLEEVLCSRKAEGLLNRRDYSGKELEERLLREGYLGSIVEGYVSRARRAGLVDDRRYAAVFVRSKAAAGWGRRRIERELERRGIGTDELDEAVLEQLDEEAERARALDVASRKTFSGRDVYAKAMRFLCGRGFSPSVSNEVARIVAESQN